MQPQSFPLSFDTPLSEKPLCEGPANTEALTWIRSWPRWSSPLLYLYGPKASGKTHLAHQWAQRTKAIFMDPTDIKPDILEKLAQKPPAALVLEHIHDAPNQENLLHFLNIVIQTKIFAILTDRLSAADLPFTLPDLTSRLRGMASVKIDQPDDVLLKQALNAHFLGRGLHVGDDVIAYLWPRMDRSFAGISTMVDRLDQASLNTQRNVSIPFVRGVLEKS